MEIKVVGIVQEVRNGQLLKLIFDEQVFVPEKQVSPQFDKPKNSFEKVGCLRNNVIYKNILAEVKQGMGKNYSFDDIRMLIKPYYSTSSDESIRTYVNVYKRFIKSG